MVNKLAIGIGAAVLVFVILFCVVPFKQVSYEATEQYQAPETYYTSEPYTVRIPYTVRTPYVENGETKWRTATEYREVTLYIDAAGQTNVWQEKTVTLSKKVSMLEYLVAY
jgi:hypothetical protein